MIEATGRVGSLKLDSGKLTIVHRSVRAGRGEITIPVENITSVEWHPAGILSGYIRIKVAGVDPRPGIKRRDIARDRYALLFKRGQQGAFEAIREALGR